MPHKVRTLYYSMVLVFLSTTPVLADSPDVAKVQSFGQNVIQILVTFSGLLAAGFFVIGGIGYITSSGNPENLEKSKRTIVYSGLGLAIAVGAFVLSSMVSDVATTAFH